MKLKLFLITIFIAGTILATTNINLSNIDFQRVVKIVPRVYGNILGVRMVPTQIFFDLSNGVEVISDFNNHRFLFRKLSGDEDNKAWKQTKISNLKRPHAITHHPKRKKYFAVDTDNHQIISFSKLNGSDSDIQRYSKLGDYEVGIRPHDIAYNSSDDHIYVVLDKGIARFLPSDEGIEKVTFVSKKTINETIQRKFPNIEFSVGYVRALTIVDGVIYLINSTQGNVIQMHYFSDPETWTVHINNDRPRKSVTKGTFDKDGLILNDIDYYDGYWYASNYYPSTIHNYLGSADNIKNKVIRWKSWEDFENSRWEDLSHLIHPESIPYYFSKYDGRLFISMFHIGNKEGEGSGIYEVKTSLL